jgi:hypothetical protein
MGILCLTLTLSYSDTIGMLRRSTNPQFAFDGNFNLLYWCPSYLCGGYCAHLCLSDIVWPQISTSKLPSNRLVSRLMS